VPTHRQVALPLVEPIVPVLRDQPFEDPAYLFEPKYDGFRGLLYLSRRECNFRSKRGKVLKQFEQLCYWVREELRVKEAILDGEVRAGEAREYALGTTDRRNVRRSSDKYSSLPRTHRAPTAPRSLTVPIHTLHVGAAAEDPPPLTNA
jgi:ATP-dependent DNA ligase